MTLVSGARIGSYEIVSALGAGGMGEVYRARDAKLHRDVALKVLPVAVSGQPDRLGRFEREARLLAALNHPNIAQIYGFEIDSGDEQSSTERRPVIVMELVDGMTLADRIRRGPGPVSDASTIARQIVEALDAAHEKGIVHRDLKPANIALTADGTVKILDFGLAKDAAPIDASELTHSPTFIGPTVSGVLLGTAPYMSPEQARGKTADKRTDIWAFGCVLYEMLAGRPPFAGETTSDVIAAILEREPDWTALPAATPRQLRRLMTRCLEKNPKRRLRDIGDAHPYLEDTSDEASVFDRRNARWRTVLASMLGALIAIAAVMLVVTTRNRSTATLPTWAAEPTILGIQIPSGVLTANGMPALSADGRQIAWVAGPRDGRPTIWVQSLANGTARALPGTEGATYPFWSPNGRSLGFTAQGQLKQIDVATGSVKSIANLPEVSIGSTWNQNNVIVFSARYGLYAIGVSGGTPRLVASLDRAYQENSLRFPRFLPDGQNFLYVARSGRPEHSGAYVGSLDGKSRRLFTTTSSVVYASPGYLLFAREGALFAQRFDASTNTIEGEATPISDRVGANAGGLNGNFDASQNGVVTYLPQNPVATAVLTWIDRSGNVLRRAGTPGTFAGFRISPDAQSVVADRVGDLGARSVWVYDAEGSPRTRVTFAGGDDWQPIWAPDGRRVAFMSYRDGPGDIYVKDIASAQPDEPLLKSEEQKVPADWSADGKYLAYAVDRAETRQDVWVLPLEPRGNPIEIARTAANEARPRFSPDGRWIAYDSDETGRPEVYVQPFPPTGGKWQVSTQGGRLPVWRGRELFFIDARETLVTVPVTTVGSTFSSGAASSLFKMSNPAGSATNMYDADPDGRTFLVRMLIDPPAQSIVVMLNWPARLRNQ